MGALLSALASFFTPVVVFFVSVVSIVVFLLTALADPQGLMNRVIVAAIDFVAQLFPSTPDELKIASIIDSAAVRMPAIGRDIIMDVFATIGTIAALSLVIKIYKLMPFKFS